MDTLEKIDQPLMWFLISSILSLDLVMKLLSHKTSKLEVDPLWKEKEGGENGMMQERRKFKVSTIG